MEWCILAWLVFFFVTVGDGLVMSGSDCVSRRRCLVCGVAGETQFSLQGFVEVLVFARICGFVEVLWKF